MNKSKHHVSSAWYRISALQTDANSVNMYADKLSETLQSHRMLFVVQNGGTSKLPERVDFPPPARIGELETQTSVHLFLRFHSALLLN
jgi:hypothetical protein